MGGNLFDRNILVNSCRESGDHGPMNSWARQPFNTYIKYGGAQTSFDAALSETHRNYVRGARGAHPRLAS